MGLTTEVLSVTSELDQRLFPLIKTGVAVAGLLLIWRLWRFTILPSFEPSEPKPLPYWLPCMTIPILMTETSEILMIVVIGDSANHLWHHRALGYIAPRKLISLENRTFEGFLSRLGILSDIWTVIMP